MKTSSTTEAAPNLMQRYPRGRWTGPAIRPSNAGQRPGALLGSFDDCALMNGDADRLTAVLEAAAVRPPFLTAMDCPMPEAA